MELLPGFLQGITRVLISYPFDYVRTNIQSQEHTSIKQYITHSNLSIRNAYRGCTIPLITVPIDRAIQFSLFERLSKNKSIIMSSIISSLISSVYSVPANYLSTHIITTHTKLTPNHVSSFIKNARHYTGFTADISKSFIGAVLYTTIYGTLRKSINVEQHNYFLFGIVSSIGSWCAIYPLDTIRVIKQTSPLSYPQIFKTMRLRNMYAGFSLILARSAPSAGCGMFVYERSKQLLL